MPEKIVLSIGQAINAYNGLNAMKRDLALPPMAGFLVNLWHEVLTPTARAFDKSRQELLAQFASKTDEDLWSFATVEEKARFTKEETSLKQAVAEFSMDRIPRDLVSQARGAIAPVFLDWLAPIMTKPAPLPEALGPTPKGVKSETT